MQNATPYISKRKLSQKSLIKQVIRPFKPFFASYFLFLKKFGYKLHNLINNKKSDRNLTKITSIS